MVQSIQSICTALQIDIEWVGLLETWVTVEIMIVKLDVRALKKPLRHGR